MLNALARHLGFLGQRGDAFDLRDDAQGGEQRRGVVVLGERVENLFDVGFDFFGMVAEILFLDRPEVSEESLLSHDPCTPSNIPWRP